MDMTFLVGWRIIDKKRMDGVNTQIAQKATSANKQPQPKA